MKPTVPQRDLYLLPEPGEDPIEPSELAKKAIVKPPPNLAIYDENNNPDPVLAQIILMAQSAKMTCENQRQQMRQKWTLADNCYWMAQKTHRMPELTRATASASVFYRVSRRLADGAYLASFSGDMPVKFLPTTSVFDIMADKQKEALVCEGLNRWAAYCMKKTELKAKAKRAYHQVYKYSNLICYVPYDYQIDKRKRYEPTDVNDTIIAEDGSLIYRNRETGEEGGQPFPPQMIEVEYDYPVKDEVGFYPLPIESCYLDNRIEDLDRQTFFLWRSDITRPELWAEARAGKFQNTNMIGALHAWQLYSMESDVFNQRLNDAGKTSADSFASEMYERWSCWMLLPKIKATFNKKGEATSLEWDQNAEPRRYVLELIGPIQGPCVCVRFCESPYWGNGIPFIDAHSHDDDTGFYHRGLVELLDDNMVQEQVAKCQMMDSRTLMNFRPLLRQQGRVKNKDMTITHNTVFDVIGDNAIKQLEVNDLSQSNKFVMDYLRDDSEKIAQTPAFMLGDAMGGRTSASEFASVRDQSSAPAMNDVRSLNMQIAGGYMRKLKEYAPQFLDKDVMVRLHSGLIAITPDEFASDLNIEEVGVQNFENQSTKQQVLINLLQVVGSNPMLQGVVNPVGLWVKICESFRSVFPNPEELVIKRPEVKAMLLEYQSQTQAAADQRMAPAELMPAEQAASEGVTEAQPMIRAGGAAKGV